MGRLWEHLGEACGSIHKGCVSREVHSLRCIFQGTCMSCNHSPPPTPSPKGELPGVQRSLLLHLQPCPTSCLPHALTSSGGHQLLSSCPFPSAHPPKHSKPGSNLILDTLSNLWPFVLWASVPLCVKLGLGAWWESWVLKFLPRLNIWLWATQSLPTSFREVPGLHLMAPGCLIPFTPSPPRHSVFFSLYLFSLVPFPPIAIRLFSFLSAHKGRGN